MKSHLILVYTKDMSRADWLAYRMTGVGASEVGAIMGLDDYTSSLELYHKKIGNVPSFDIENIAMFMGKEQEDFIATLWQYWDPHQPNDEQLILNYRTDTIMRRCRRVNAFVRNPAYPWLYVSLDRLILKQDGRGEGTLECKTIGGWEAEKWEAGLPPKYVTQVQTQMKVVELEWGEMALFEDGRHFNALPFEPSKIIQEEIIERTKGFWERVERGRELVARKVQAQLGYNYRLAEELDHAIDENAPPPDGTLVYDKYLSERFKRPPKLERAGTHDELMWAYQHRRFATQLKDIQEQQLKVQSLLKASMGNFQVLNFDKDGKVYWSQNAAGNRNFANKIKAA